MNDITEKKDQGSQVASRLTIAFHLDPVPNARVGNYGLLIRNKIRGTQEKTDFGSVV